MVRTGSRGTVITSAADRKKKKKDPIATPVAPEAPQFPLSVQQAITKHQGSIGNPRVGGASVSAAEPQEQKVTKEKSQWGVVPKFFTGGYKTGRAINKAESQRIADSGTGGGIGFEDVNKSLSGTTITEKAQAINEAPTRVESLAPSLAERYAGELRAKEEPAGDAEPELSEEDLQIIEDSKWAGARRRMAKVGDEWVVEYFTQVDQEDGSTAEEILSRIVITSDERKQLQKLEEEQWSKSNNPKLQEILDNQKKVRGTDDVSENALRDELEYQLELYNEQLAEARSIAGSTFREAIFKSVGIAAITAAAVFMAVPSGGLSLGGLAISAKLAAGTTFAVQAYNGFSGAYTANQKESVSVLGKKFKEAKGSLNTLPAFVNDGTINPYMAEIIYQGGMRRIRAYRAELKKKEANNWIADISDYDSDMGKIDEWIASKGRMLGEQIFRKKIDPTFQMSVMTDVDDLVSMGYIDADALTA